MTEAPLEYIGHRIAQLRYQHQLKQSELASETGVSLRTLQRLEAGDIVKTDVLLKVLQRLGRLDALLQTLALAELSPYEQLEEAGLSSSDLDKRSAATVFGLMASNKRRGHGIHKRRVRHSSTSSGGRATSAGVSKKAGVFQWPEDQAS